METPEGRYQPVRVSVGDERTSCACARRHDGPGDGAAVQTRPGHLRDTPTAELLLQLEAPSCQVRRRRQKPRRPPPTPHRRRTGMGRSASGLLLAALGIVFGDIGTSSLYALQPVFSIDAGAVPPTEGTVYGVISMMFWSVTLIVSTKYIGVLMRADNDGEGGVMALTALAR